MIRDVHPRSWIRTFIFYPSRIPASKKAPDPGSATLIKITLIINHGTVAKSTRLLRNVSLTGVVVNTFSSRSEDSTGGLSSSLPPASASSHVVTSDVIKTRMLLLQVMILRNFCTTQPLLLLFHLQHLHLQAFPPSASPLPTLPAEPRPALLSGLFTPLSVGGKYT
jgi:hypothetical protein